MKNKHHSAETPEADLRQYTEEGGSSEGSNSGVNSQDPATGIHSLAPVQRKTLEFLRSYIAMHGYAPTLRDIATHICVKSPSTAHFHLSRLEGKGYLKRSEDGAFELVESVEVEPTQGANMVPLVGMIAAGSPIEAIEEQNVLVEIPRYLVEGKGKVYCLQVTGDSMIGAHIIDGDVIIVREQSVAQDGEVVVALLEDGGATLKTFRRMKGGKIMLLPHNPEHSPIPGDGATIQGRVVGVMREI